MKSLVVTISRTGDPDNTNLSPDTRYLALTGWNPEVTFSIDCKQEKFYENVEQLRYRDGDPSSSDNAVIFFKELINKLFADLIYARFDNNGNEPLHIRLVTAPMELAQLPFEFMNPAALPGGLPLPELLVNPSRLITLTREVRQESEAKYVWPRQPRILFAWAEPGNSVPHEEHKQALLKSLSPLLKPIQDKPDPVPDSEPFLTELQNASLKLIGDEIKKAIAGSQPYSHIHILAHGGATQSFRGVTFNLLLSDDDSTETKAKINGEALAKAIVPDRNGEVPVVVTLSVCDSGSAGNLMVPSGSLTYQLHRAGIPCVFASQFPFTQEGSVTLAETLYSQLINAVDPREALYNTRIALKKTGSHDWASLVAYARFPDDIEEQLQAIRLKMLFNAMKVPNAWVDHVAKFKDNIPEARQMEVFADVLDRLENTINDLQKPELLSSSQESKLRTDSLKSEHLGLLGSAWKRKSEHLLRMTELAEITRDNLVQDALNALNMAKQFYEKSSDADNANHWSTMQYLSLKAILDGSLMSEAATLTFLQVLTSKQLKTAPENSLKLMWASGTLMELFLLQPLAASDESFMTEKQSALKQAKFYYQIIRNSNNEDVIESTERQLDRYIFCWPKLNPETYRKELSEMALEIKESLV